MMGINHAISGAAAWVALTVTAENFPSLGLIHLEPWQLATGAIVCAGAALLPDADHPHATIAHALPGGSLLAGATGALTGGHRHGMHSILAIIATWLLTGLIGGITWQPDWWHQAIPIGAAITIAALLTFAVKVLKIMRTWPKAWLTGITAAAILALFLPDHVGWFQLCVTLGYTVHIVGDFLTIQGINWFWPLKLRAPGIIANTPIVKHLWGSNGYFALPILGTAGSWREHLLGMALAAYTLMGLGIGILEPFTHH